MRTVSVLRLRQQCLQAQVAIELKDAQQNVLLGQYHLQDEKFVSAKPLRQAARPPAAETVRWQQAGSGGGSTGRPAKQELF